MSMPRNAVTASLAILLTLTVGACARDADNTTTADTAVTDAAAAPAAEATPPAAELPPTAPAPCNADAVQSLVGQASSDAVIEQARVDSGASSVRALKPGDAATMDYREDRLNITLDDSGVIQTLRCG